MCRRLQEGTLNKLAEHLQVVQHSSYNYQLFILQGVAPHYCQGGDGVRDRESLDVGMVGGSQCGPFSQSLLAGGKIEGEVNIRDQYI